MDSETITHEGIITRVGKEEIEVKILSKSACAACHAKSACSMSDMAEKTLIIPHDGKQSFTLMQKVNIKMSVGQAGKAVVLAYVVPFCILIATLIVLLTLQIEDGLAAIISIATLIPYYIILYKCRNRIKKKFRYEVETL